MRFAVVESGGKQYRAVEGEVLEVDRLAVEEGKQINLERILMVADGGQVQVGTPTLGGIEVKVTVLDHVKGPKVTRFRYSPKKRIRVRGGHRQQYTRLMVDFIGSKGEVRKVEKAEPAAPVKAVAAQEPRKAASKKATAKKTAGTKPAVKKSAR